MYIQDNVGRKVKIINNPQYLFYDPSFEIENNEGIIESETTKGILILKVNTIFHDIKRYFKDSNVMVSKKDIEFLD